MVIYDYTSSPVSSQEDARSLVKELRGGGGGTHLFAKSTTRMTTSDGPRRRSRSVQRTVPDPQPRSQSKSRTRTQTAREGANTISNKDRTGQPPPPPQDDDDDDDDEPLLYQEPHDEPEPEWELEDDDDDDSWNDSDNEAACLAAARRSLSGDLLGMATAALPTTTTATANTAMPYVDLELVECQTMVSNLSMDMTNTLHSTSPGTTPLPSSSSESDVDDEPNQYYNDKVLHNLLCQGEWDLLEQHLEQLYGTPSLLRRALLHRNDAQETVLQVLCCQAPPAVALRCLEALDRLNLAESILTTAVDAAENTILHTVCAHVRSRRRRRTPKTLTTSSSTTTTCSSLSSSRRSRSRPPSRRYPRDKSRSRPHSQSPARGDKRSSSCESPRRRSSSSKHGAKRQSRVKSRPPSSSSKRPEKSTPSCTKSSSKSKAKRRHSHSHGGVTMPALIPIDESESSHPSEAAESIHEVPSTTTTTTTPHSFSVLEFSILQQLVVLAPHLLERTNHFGDTPLHLLVASPGLSKAKYKHRSTETCMAAELAAHDVLGQCLQRVPRSVAVHANRRGLTLLHGAIARGAHELVLVQLLQHLRHAAALPDVRGWYPLHYVAVHPSLIPWTFCHDLIAAYPQALVAQSYDTGDAPLHLLLSRISKSIRTHDKKKKKKKNKEPKKTRRSMGHSSSSGSNQPKYYLDRNTAKLAELLSKSTSEWHSGSSNAREGRKRSSPSTRVRIDSSTSNSNSSSPTVPTCALLLQNYQHWSPLHYCAKLGAAAERLVHVWRKKSPRGMHQASVLSTQTERVTPLHMACAQKPCSHDMVQALALCGPHACAAQDSQGRTPLAVAICNSSVSSSMVQSLIDVYPQAVELASHGNYLPLHLALQQERSETICHSLIRASAANSRTKKSLEAATVAGDTPLHMACAQSQSSVRVVKLLAERFPEAIFLRNTAGQSPFDLARIFNPTLLKAIPQLETARQDLLLHNNNKNDPDESSSPTPQLSPKTAAVEGTKRRKSISGILRRTD